MIKKRKILMCTFATTKLLAFSTKEERYIMIRVLTIFTVFFFRRFSVMVRVKIDILWAQKNK